MRLTFSAILLAAVVSGCASTAVDTPAGPDLAGYVRPELQVRTSGSIFFGSGYTAPLSLNVDIMNQGPAAVVVRRIRIESPGMSQYRLDPATREFRQTINPGETITLSMSALARTGIDRLSTSEPLQLRALVEYELGDARRREVYSIQAIE